jgi:type II secretory pathway component PulM
MSRAIARQWLRKYQSLGERERRVVRWGGVAAIVLLGMSMVLSFQRAVHAAELRVTSKRADLAYIQSVLPELRTLPPSPVSADQSMVALVDRGIQAEGLVAALRGTEPSGAGGVTVHLESAEAGAVLRWLVRVQRQENLKVTALTLDKAASAGQVTGSITLAAR